MFSWVHAVIVWIGPAFEGRADLFRPLEDLRIRHQKLHLLHEKDRGFDYPMDSPKHDDDPD